MLNEPDDTSQPMGSALSLLQTPMAALLIRPCNALALEALHTNMPMQLSHDCKFVCNAWTPKPITKEATPGNDSYEAQHLRQRVISNQAVIIMQQKRYYSKMIFQLPFQCKSVVLILIKWPHLGNIISVGDTNGGTKEPVKYSDDGRKRYSSSHMSLQLPFPCKAVMRLVHLFS